MIYSQGLFYFTQVRLVIYSLGIFDFIRITLGIIEKDVLNNRFTFKKFY